MAVAPSTPTNKESPEKELPEKVVRGIVRHVNEDHRQEMLECALAFGNTPWATDATLERFDRTGMDLFVEGNGREQKCGSGLQRLSNTTKIFKPRCSNSSSEPDIKTERKLMTCSAVKRFGRFVLFFLLITLASAQVDTFPVTLEHENGVVTVEQAPERVAVLGLRSLELLAALGIQSVAVATTNALPSDPGGTLDIVPGYEELISRPVIYLGTSEMPSLETLASVKPDLILDENPGGTNSELLSEIAPTVSYSYYTQDSWQKGLRGIAKLFGRSNEAEGYIENYNQQVANLRDSLAVSGETIAVIIVYEQNLILLDPNNSIADLIAELGFSIAVPEGLTGDEQGFIFLSLETLPELQADKVLLINRGGNAGTVQQASALLVNFGEGLFTYDYPPTLGINGPYSNILLLNDLVELFKN